MFLYVNDALSFPSGINMCVSHVKKHKAPIPPLAISFATKIQKSLSLLSTGSVDLMGTLFLLGQCAPRGDLVVVVEDF